MKKLRKTIVRKHTEYFYHITDFGYECKYCDFKSEELDSEHVIQYHSEEMDLEQHMVAHKEGKCKCSGSVIEL